MRTVSIIISQSAKVITRTQDALLVYMASTLSKTVDGLVLLILLCADDCKIWYK